MFKRYDAKVNDWCSWYQQHEVCINTLHVEHSAVKINTKYLNKHSPPYNCVQVKNINKTWDIYINNYIYIFKKYICIYSYILYVCIHIYVYIHTSFSSSPLLFSSFCSILQCCHVVLCCVVLCICTVYVWTLVQFPCTRLHVAMTIKAFIHSHMYTHIYIFSQTLYTYI